MIHQRCLVALAALGLLLGVQPIYGEQIPGATAGLSSSDARDRSQVSSDSLFPIQTVLAQSALLDKPAVAPGVLPSDEEMAMARRFIAARFANSPEKTSGDPLFSSGPPFSFVYDGKPSADFLDKWKTQRQSAEARRTSHGTYGDLCRSRRQASRPLRGGRVRRFSHRGMDAVFQEFRQVRYADPRKHPIARRSLASATKKANFCCIITSVRRPKIPIIRRSKRRCPADASKRITAKEGRSTQSDLSYFNLERSKDEGLIVGRRLAGPMGRRFHRATQTAAYISARARS